MMIRAKTRNVHLE